MLALRLIQELFDTVMHLANSMKNLTPIVLILIAIGLFFFHIEPTYSGDITSKRELEKQYLKALETAERISIVQGRLVESYNTISAAEFTRLQKAIPKEIDEIQLMIDINAIALEHGLVTENIAVSGGGNTGESSEDSFNDVGGGGFVDGADDFAPVTFGPQNNALLETSVGFSVTTDYDTFLRFLQDVERSLRLIDVTNITIDSGSSGSGAEGGVTQVSSGDVLTYNLTITTYSLE